MALTRQNRSITWAAAGSKTLTTSARADSDAMALDATDVAGAIQIKADNQGTPASGDVVYVWIKWSPDGTTFDTDEHAEGPYALDTYASNAPGEDPAVMTIPIYPGRAHSYKLSVSCANAATRNVIVSAIEQTQRAA